MQHVYLTGKLARTLIVRAKPARRIRTPIILLAGSGDNLYKSEHEDTRQISIDKRLRHEIRTDLAG